MGYGVISYPELYGDGLERIQSYRKINDPWLYRVIKPHVTFVFPTDGISKDDFTGEITELAREEPGFEFAIRCATVNKDSFSDYYHTLLVPDEGHSRIVKLHDRLYSRKLSADRRLDIDFIPHIGLATSKDKYRCKRMADEWNESRFEIRGAVLRLSIVEFKDGMVTTLGNVELFPPLFTE